MDTEDVLWGRLRFLLGDSLHIFAASAGILKREGEKERERDRMKRIWNGCAETLRRVGLELEKGGM
jgi:hypothetical protein